MELENLKGVGDKTINILKRLGINSQFDLVSYYPFRYNFIEETNIDMLENQDKIVIDGLVDSLPIISYISKSRDKMEFKINTNKKIVSIVIFNRGFMKNKITLGLRITVMGKYDKFKNLIIASDIRLSSLENLSKIEPIYHVTTGINSNQINALINKIKIDINDYIPDYLIEKYKFKSKEICLKEIHNPSNTDNLKNCIERLKYEELFIFMLKMNYLKKQKESVGIKRNVCKEKITEIMNSLPFELTVDQITCVDEIYTDLVSSKKMNRLLQGDVGSGKTIVAFLSLYINYLSNHQGALMAPTEILARQHYLNIKSLFPKLKVVLLTGKLKIKEKKEIIEQISSGEADIIIGTHALISKEVKYNKLGLVITDEQHRFGVNQRGNLKNKGIIPDVLYMSATPIPRTYAITLFGDMDISNIKTKPSGRKEIKTYLKSNKEIKEVLILMYEELKKGHQIYVVAPLIEESENSDLENVNKIKEKMMLAFGKLYKVDLMHGKLSNKEKERVIDSFKNNEINILISTTVIEVGVDVPNATVMVVFDSYNFGLSALHQLRGRVGRSDIQSYFVLLSDIDAARLRILVKTNDGFEVSESDFKLRGSGDMFGIKQSGDMTFRLADIKKDFKMLIKAKEDSLDFIENHIDNYNEIKKVISDLSNLD